MAAMDLGNEVEQDGMQFNISTMYGLNIQAFKAVSLNPGKLIPPGRC